MRIKVKNRKGGGLAGSMGTHGEVLVGDPEVTSSTLLREGLRTLAGSQPHPGAAPSWMASIRIGVKS